LTAQLRGTNSSTSGQKCGEARHLNGLQGEGAPGRVLAVRILLLKAHNLLEHNKPVRAWRLISRLENTEEEEASGWGEARHLNGLRREGACGRVLAVRAQLLTAHNLLDHNTVRAWRLTSRLENTEEEEASGWGEAGHLNGLRREGAAGRVLAVRILLRAPHALHAPVLGVRDSDVRVYNVERFSPLVAMRKNKNLHKFIRERKS